MPLFLSSRVDPNLVFVIDDSGSMQFEIMPDDYVYSSIRFVFPRANNVYGSTDYSNYVVTVDDNRAFNALARSSKFNTVYYDPSITYRPWIKANGDRYPNAVANRAYHNPENTGVGFRDLTANNTQSARWGTCASNGNCSLTNNVNKTFYPATYFYHKGGSQWEWGNYTKVEIRSTTPTYEGHGRQNRTDCANAANAQCTYAEEIQNFANWYTYYRSRILTARAGIGEAFSQQGEGMRVGFGSINTSSNNVDAVSTATLLTGVRPFSGEDRKTFFEKLYTLPIPAQGTPLRKALDDVGQYYRRSDNRGPWGNTPGTDDSTPHLECRHCYTVLMTDGYWNGSAASTSAARRNNDGEKGATITGPGGKSYAYAPSNPFQDNRSDTLADVAMYYWKTDLRDLANKVPISNRNPAFWQHMVTYGVGLGVTGSIKPEDAWNAIDSGTAIAWGDPLPESATATKLDDLLHAAVNSRGGFFSAADPESFARELSSALRDIVNRGVGAAAAIAANSTRLSDNTFIYQARFYSTDWSGQVLAYKLNSEDGAIDSVKWDTDDNKIPAHGSRKIVTSAPGVKGGNYFTWDGLTAEQKSALQNGGTVQQGKDRLNWLRGSQVREVDKKDGYLRKRSRILGDIVNSDPVIVGASHFGYQNLPVGTPGRDEYLSFVNQNKIGPQVIYVGANDGMLHAFNADTGEEIFAYVPSSVYNNLAELSDPNYVHRYYVDGSPFMGHAYVDGEWKTILVCSLGAGGGGIFALDISDPENFGPDKVLWDISDQQAGFEGLGRLIGQPSIGRMQDGSWVAIFGNGYDSGQAARLYVVDIKTGQPLAGVDLSTGVGSATLVNGLSTPSPLVDKYQTVKSIYAGDLQGNLWKFDVSSDKPAEWNVPFKEKGKPAPLFTAKDANGKVQPITSQPEFGIHPEGGYMVYFGTGKYFETSDNKVSKNPQIQSFYGIWDNEKNNSQISGRSELVGQSILWEIAVNDNLWRITSSNFKEGQYSQKRGWYLDLKSPVAGGQGERVISLPFLRHGRVIFTTLIPSSDPCEPGGSGWLMELDAATGNLLDYAVLDVNGDGEFDQKDLVKIVATGEESHIAGKFLGTSTEIGTILRMGPKEKKIGTEATGGIFMEDEAGSPYDGFGRRSWRQLR